MAIDVRSTLRKALAGLKSRQTQIDGQISAIETALGALDGQRRTIGSPRRRRPMSAKARKVIAKRMKAYWAKRKARSSKKSK